MTALAVLVLAALNLSAIAASSGDRIRVAQASAGNRIALVIGNATYPDDNKPLTQPIKDARALAKELERSGFEVILKEDLSKQKLRAALDEFKGKIKPGSAALFFFSGYGIQTGKQSYIIPVDAQIWTEGEVKRDGVTVESILNDMNAAGAMVKVIIIDAARRNPFERRFRGFSAGLASLNVPAGTLAMYSAAPDRVANESDGENSLFVSELLKEMRSPGSSVETIFNNTRMGVSRASKSEQVPFVSSSLTEEFSFGKAPASRPAPAPPEPALPPTPSVAEPEPEPAPKPTPSIAEPEPEPSPKPTPSVAEPAPEPSPPAPEPKPSVAMKPPAEEPAPPPEPSRPEAKSPERDEIIQGLDDQIRRNPRDADAFYRRGQAWAQRGEFALASDDFGEAIRINPQDAESLNNRCFTRAVMGQLEGALSDCNEAIRLRGDYADALDSRGLTHLKLGQYDRAIDDFSAAIRIDPKMASALFGRGKAKLKKGDRTSGNADIRSAKSIDPTVENDYKRYGVR
ncbi:MAG: caspase family protein [Xanthobacteraceae bacterium]